MISVENKYLFLMLLILGILFYNIKKYETKNRLCHMGIISKKSNIFYQSTYLRYKLEKEALLLIQKNFFLMAYILVKKIKTAKKLKNYLE